MRIRRFIEASIIAREIERTPILKNVRCARGSYAGGHGHVLVPPGDKVIGDPHDSSRQEQVVLAVEREYGGVRYTSRIFDREWVDKAFYLPQCRPRQQPTA